MTAFHYELSQSEYVFFEPVPNFNVCVSVEADFQNTWKCCLRFIFEICSPAKNNNN